MGEVDEVIEIESDEEQNVEEEEHVELLTEETPAGKVLFSSLFSQSSHESEGELEVSNVEEAVSKESDVDDPSNDAEDLVIVEDSSNSTEFPVEESDTAAQSGAVLFSTFGKVESEDRK